MKIQTLWFVLYSERLLKLLLDRCYSQLLLHYSVIWYGITVLIHLSGWCVYYTDDCHVSNLSIPWLRNLQLLVSVLFLPIIFTCMALPALKTVVKKLIMAEFIATFCWRVMLHPFIKACLSIKLFYQRLTPVIYCPII